MRLSAPEAAWDCYQYKALRLRCGELCLQPGAAAAATVATLAGPSAEAEVYVAFNAMRILPAALRTRCVKVMHATGAKMPPDLRFDEDLLEANDAAAYVRVLQARRWTRPPIHPPTQHAHAPCSRALLLRRRPPHPSQLLDAADDDAMCLIANLCEASSGRCPSPPPLASQSAPAVAGPTAVVPRRCLAARGRYCSRPGPCAPQLHRHCQGSDRQLVQGALRSDRVAHGVFRFAGAAASDAEHRLEYGALPL